MLQGRILKGIGGFYYVLTEDSILYECRARGLFKLKNKTPMVGDMVLIQVQSEEPPEGYIMELLERTSELFRPAVSNVEQAVLVFAVKNPEFNYFLLDKMLLLCSHAHINPLICINKADLGIDSALRDRLEIYKNAGYTVIETSTKEASGSDSLKAVLKDKVTVFAGPSGVGKSSLLNTVQTNLRLQTGAVSEKIKRGRHTTRHSELMPLEFGGWVVDTPGFTSLELEGITPEMLPDYFPEFQPYIDQCQFRDCKHLNEPGCEILAHVGSTIHPDRYSAYKSLQEQVLQDRRKKSW